MDNRLTKFEKVRILGQRAEQIANGAPSTVDITGLTDALTIAEKELKERMIPFKIRRTYPNGEVRDIPLSEMVWE
jgi:DNA-directed RNA polymerase I, II, and III subunit RPABC2